MRDAAKDMKSLFPKEAAAHIKHVDSILQEEDGTVLVRLIQAYKGSLEQTKRYTRNEKADIRTKYICRVSNYLFLS